MNVPVMVSIPVKIYHEAEAEAEATHRTVEEVLTAQLNPADSSFYQGPELQQMLREEEAFEAMSATLLQQHLNDYVAVHQGQLVDHDRDEEALLRRIAHRYPDQVILIRQVMPYAPSTLVLRSPRFARSVP